MAGIWFGLRAKVTLLFSMFQPKTDFLGKSAVSGSSQAVRDNHVACQQTASPFLGHPISCAGLQSEVLAA